MDIATAITTQQNQVSTIYNTIASKGGMLPITKNLQNMNTAVDSIPGAANKFLFYDANVLYLIENDNISVVTPNDWETLARVLPEVKFMSTNIGHSWSTGIGLPLVINDNVTNASGFLQAASRFNQPITIPNSVTNMNNFLNSASNFDQPITIPNSVTNINSLLALNGVFNQPITIPSNVINANGFLNCNSFVGVTTPVNYTSKVTCLAVVQSNWQNFMSYVQRVLPFGTFTLELREVQTITTRPTYFLNGCISLTSSDPSYVDLRIRSGSAGVNVSARTWAGMYFKSITLIDANGNAV